MDITSLLHLAVSKGASDLHLVAASPPLLRINGLLQQKPKSALIALSIIS